MTNTPGDDQPPQDPTAPSYGEQPAGGYPQQGQPPYPQQGQPPYPQQGYPPAPGYPPVQYAPDHPKATTSLVLGILGVVLCQVIAPFAWRTGKRTLNEIDASQGQYGGRGAAQAGYILGIVGTVLLGLGLLYLVGILALVVIGGVSSGSSG